jgi:cyclase
MTRPLVVLVAAVVIGTGRPEGRPLHSATEGRARDQQTRTVGDGEVHVLPVQGKVYMLVGAGGNVTLQIGDEGVLIVDAQSAQMSDKIVAAIRQLSDKPIRYVVNTHFHADHTGGNENLARAGSTRAGGNVVGDIGASATESAAIIAHENVLKRMSAPTGRPAPTPFRAWPTDTFFNDVKELFFNGEGIQILHQPAAHTDGDSLVFFRRSDVISTGDVFVTTTYPVIDTQAGGSVNGVIDALNRIIDLTIPNNVQEGGTMVIPGHGRLCDEMDVVEYRDMVTIVRDRIQTMIKRGMTFEQIKAARPTLDFDARYGAETGAWTTAMFIETVYRNLAR